MKRDRHRESSLLRRVVLGLILIAAGSVLMLEKMNLLSPDVTRWLFTWQMLLVAIGFVNLFSRENYISGLILIMIGTFFLVPKILDLSFNFIGMFWPLLLIGGGVLIILKQGSRHSCRRDWRRDFDSVRYDEAKVSEEGYIDSMNVFSGSKRNVSSVFRGGRFVNVFGGTEVNFAQAVLDYDPVIIETVCIFGGSTYFVPSDWEVQIEVVSILGGFTDKRAFVSSSTIGEPRKRIIIKGVCVFGGGEVKGIS